MLSKTQSKPMSWIEISGAGPTTEAKPGETPMIDPDAVPADDIQQLISAQHEQRVREIKRAYRNDRLLIVTLGLALFVFSILGPWVVAQLPARPLPVVVQVEGLTVVGNAELCPGNVLTYSYQLVADSAGIIEIDTSAVRVDAVHFMVPSAPSRIVIDGPMRVPMTERWVVPEFARDPRTGEFLQWQPGNYLRTLSISTPGQSTTPAIAAVPFSIRANCPARPF